MRSCHYRLSSLLIASLSLALAGCGSGGATSETMLADATKIAVNTPQLAAPEPEPGIDTESTIFTWLGMAKRPSQQRAGPHVGPNVSQSLWIAAHDTLRFVEVASEDPQSGILITEWYSPQGKPTERLRVAVSITSYALRSDSMRLTIDRQVRGADGTWTDSTVDRKTVADLEGAILLRARQIHAETYRNQVLSK